MDFHSKVCIVTGSSSGIGAAVARGLSERGAIVIGWDIADYAETQTRDCARRFKVDVRDGDAIQTACKQSIAEYQSIDFLVCCAGVVRRGDALQATIEEWDLVNEVNLRGVFFR